MKAQIQKLGAFLSSMVMPNIGALIAWGLVTSLFLATGYFPCWMGFDKLIGPTLTYLIPLLFAYTGGKKIYDTRGAVIGVVATMGVIIGSDTTMMIGGMIMGPLAAWCMKQVDKLFKGRVKPGLEMLVDNFSLGILGAILMCLGFKGVAPLIAGLTQIITQGVGFLVKQHLLPFVELFVVPGQILFLNNAINHGIFTPLGTAQVAAIGKSIYFLIEANGGMWAGLILAYCFFGKGMAKKSAPGAFLIMFVGGIGEVAFPYALIKPITMFGPMLGGVAAMFWYTIMGGGAVAPVSPGSVVMMAAMAPKGELFINLGGYAIATAVSFIISAFFLKMDKTPVEEEIAAETAIGTQENGTDVDLSNVDLGGKRSVKKIVVACDAGMGSSVMAASMLQTQINKCGLSLKVGHESLSALPDDIDVMVTSANLYERAKTVAPKGAIVIPIKELMSQQEHKEIAQKIKEISE